MKRNLWNFLFGFHSIIEPNTWYQMIKFHFIPFIFWVSFLYKWTKQVLRKLPWFSFLSLTIKFGQIILCNMYHQSNDVSHSTKRKKRKFAKIRIWLVTKEWAHHSRWSNWRGKTACSRRPTKHRTPTRLSSLKARVGNLDHLHTAFCLSLLLRYARVEMVLRRSVAKANLQWARPLLPPLGH